MFEVTDIKFLENSVSTKDIVVYYKYTGTEHLTIKINAKDLLFETTSFCTSVDISPGGSYWSRINTTSNSICTTYFTMGVVLDFTSEGNVLYSKKINFIHTDFNRRTKNNTISFDKPNFWVVGDSHVGFYFNDYDLNLLDRGSYNINWISHLELSLNRFLKRDWKTFLKTIPIIDGDVISFNLGDIDLRVALFKNAKYKNCSPEYLLSTILMKYVSFIKEIKILYPNNEIVILSPNPPVRNDSITDSYLIAGDEIQRKKLWDQFNDFILSEYKVSKTFYYWNTMRDYMDDEGYMKTNLLIENNNHVNNGELFVNSLINHIDNSILFK